MKSENIIEIVGDTYSTEILSATTDPKSAGELSDDLDVPVATCYRRIRELTKYNLLEYVDRPLSDHQRRIKVYRRNVDKIEIDFDDGMSVNVSERDVVKNKLDDVWRTTQTETISDHTAISRR